MPLGCMKIQQTIVEVNFHFEGKDGLSFSTIDRVLQHNRVCMKQVYRVPFQCNSERAND